MPVLPVVVEVLFRYRNMSLESLTQTLNPLIQILKEIALNDAKEAKSILNKKAPFDGELIKNIGNEIKKGAKDGWLLPKEQGGIRFGRISKDLEGFSVDAVLMSSPGPRHRHGNGEIDLCFATKGNPQFDGHPEGWVIYPPNSVHVPTVTAGEMLILYFLPGGAIEFL